MIYTRTVETHQTFPCPSCSCFSHSDFQIRIRHPNWDMGMSGNETSFVYQEPSGITDASWALLRYICVRRVRWSIFFPPHVMFFGIPDLIFVSSVRSNSLNCSLGVHCTVHLFSTLMSQSMFELQRQDVQIVVVSPAGARPWARRL